MGRRFSWCFGLVVDQPAVALLIHSSGYSKRVYYIIISCASDHLPAFSRVKVTTKPTMFDRGGDANSRPEITLPPTRPPPLLI